MRVILIVSSRLRYPKGSTCSHSIELLIFLLQINICFILIASHKIIINISKAVNDVIAPIEDNMFNDICVSG